MLKIYNSLSRSKQEFIPIEPGKVRMYVCGMTVYDYCHLGHGRVMVVFDIVQRWLRASGFDVTYVRNITDIDDKIIQRAAVNGESIDKLTARFISAMHEDAAALGIERPNFEPRATECIAEMQNMISTLIDKGYAYPAKNGDVYYAVHQFNGYGRLSGKSLDDLRAGERADVDPAKHDPMDFVLWKAAKPGEPAWDAPWGSGRPGWHIECSAMSDKLLGAHFDIHGGGEDLQFPHHENEVAQSEGAHGCTFVNYWMHNGFVRVNDEKMSKSLGNFFTVREILKKFDAEVVRFFILRAHYRSPLSYSDQHLEDARHALSRLYTTLKPFADQGAEIDWNHPYTLRFKAAMDDDFNTAEAFAVLFDLANAINKSSSAHDASLLKGLAGILGFLQQTPIEFLQRSPGSAVDSAQVESLIFARNKARKEKDFAESDRIRKQLLDLGIALEDTAQGTQWRNN